MSVDAGGCLLCRDRRVLVLCAVQSHTSYGRCGLGSDGTDRLVGLVQALAAESAAEQPAAGLYGAKITGGGSGGTVCVLGAAGEQSKAQIKQVGAAVGSGPGARAALSAEWG